MKLYPFDEGGGDLDYVPLAARRALDALRVKLSLDAWRALPLAAREALSGGADDLDLDALRPLVGGVPATPIAPDDPEVTWAEGAATAPEPPPEVVRLRTISGDAWRALSALDRYVLARYARRGRPARFDEAFAAIVGA